MFYYLKKLIGRCVAVTTIKISVTVLIGKSSKIINIKTKKLPVNEVYDQNYLYQVKSNRDIEF